jgi:transposase-like protein
MLERNGNVMTAVVADNKRATLLPRIVANVAAGSEIHTDYLHSYQALGAMGYTHKRVNHSKGEYCTPEGVTTNTLEGFWGNVQRGINGTHIHVSAKHLPAYLGEFEFRWNMRGAPHLMLDRLLTAFQR